MEVCVELQSLATDVTYINREVLELLTQDGISTFSQYKLYEFHKAYQQITETVRLDRLHWFGHVQRIEQNRIPKEVVYMNLETRMRGRPRNRWQDEVRQDGRLVSGKKGWKERVHNREEWKKLLRTARNRRILHMPMECME